MMSSAFYYVLYVLSAVALLVSAAPCATEEHAAATTKTPAKTTVSEAASASINIAGTHTGQGTWYSTGLGACGVENSDSDLIAAVGHGLFDAFPGYSGANPNDNPVCGRTLTAHYGGKSVTVTVADRCVGCGTWDLDFSPAAFTHLASESVGRLSGVSWSFN